MRARHIVGAAALGLIAAAPALSNDSAVEIRQPASDLEVTCAVVELTHAGYAAGTRINETIFDNGAKVRDELRDLGNDLVNGWTRSKTYPVGLRLGPGRHVLVAMVEHNGALKVTKTAEVDCPGQAPPVTPTTPVTPATPVIPVAPLKPQRRKVVRALRRGCPRPTVVETRVTPVRAWTGSRTLWFGYKRTVRIVRTQVKRPGSKRWETVDLLVIQRLGKSCAPDVEHAPIEGKG